MTVTTVTIRIVAEISDSRSIDPPWAEKTLFISIRSLFGLSTR
jgi:hypothetical protein